MVLSMHFSQLRQAAPRWALGLALALLLLTGWGQVHRVIHPGVSAAAVLASAGAQAAAPAQDEGPTLHAGHAAGDSRCLLLDHLAEGAAPLQTPLRSIADQPAAPMPWLDRPAVSLLAGRPFDARGPPPLA